ncbi:MAG: hypothetical protein CMC13_14880 [Flavobacteriaceae bacterium]|nr:hypothetical protein [Flavobacteriaceae bacterium]|tara:strand:- start:132 stop:485 length:354 start_codon:yes stop_codon:yes gene_type:complete
MEIDYNHLLNSVINSIENHEITFRQLEKEIKHFLVFSVEEPSPFLGEPAIIVNFHFNGFRKHLNEINKWHFKFYMYSKDRGVRFLGRHEYYPELIKSLYEKIQDIARVEQTMRVINS